MLSLDSPQWSILRHAYGDASDIPNLLRQLKDLPQCEGDSEPWSSIWSSLAHQGDVYSASFAAVPHVISCLASAPTRADFSFFQFPAWGEICRRKQNVPIPSVAKGFPSVGEAVMEINSDVAEKFLRWHLDL